MQNLEKTIHEAIRDVGEQRGLTLPPIGDQQHLIADLGFKSLDLAQLIAVLETTLRADPFARLIPITQVRTVGDLCSAYRQFLDGTAVIRPNEAETHARRTPTNRHVRRASRGAA
jgi:acyl carrier protein